MARSLRPPPSEASAGGGGKVFFAIASLLLVGTALWVFTSESRNSSEVATATEMTEPAPAAANDTLPEAVVEAADETGERPSAVEVPAAPPAAAELPQGSEAPNVLHAPKVVAPGKSPTARTAAKPHDDSAEAPPPAGAFSRELANQALEAAAAGAGRCRRVGDPTGVARVEVTFAPSGRVTAATVKGKPFAGTRTGSCIAKRMRELVVPAFAGDHVTIAKTVTIM